MTMSKPLLPGMRWLVATLLAGLCSVWAAPAQADKLVIIKNSTHPRYEDAARVISARLGDKHEILTVDLTGLGLEEARKRAVAMLEADPALVIALGDKAVFLADKHMKPKPVLFAMVSNWQALKLDRSRIAGVSMQLDPETMASQVKMFMPKARRIGVVYTAQSRAYVERAMRKAAELELTILPIFIKDGTEFIEVMSAVAPVLDLFWLVEDPAIASKENLTGLMSRAAEHTMPTLCHSPGLVEVGLTLSISPDREEVGRQLVAQIETLLGGAAMKAVDVEPPAKAKITINRDQLKALQLEIDPMLLGFAHQVSTATGKKRR